MYEFNWELLGDVKDGRPNLGSTVEIEAYRLMHFTMRDVLEKTLGTKQTDKIFFEAGQLAGAEFYKHYIVPVDSTSDFIRKTQEVLKSKKIGILRIEEALFEKGKVMLTIDEDMECSGLPELDYETCVYDEGFISGIFTSFTKENWSAEEIDCWTTGARTCRFEVKKE